MNKTVKKSACSLTIPEIIINGPSNPDQEFILSGINYGKVYARAAEIITIFATEKSKGEPVCLATEDKSVIASAVIASLAGGPDLVLPYSYSDQVLRETRESTGFTRVISDSKELPEGMEPVLVSSLGFNNSLMKPGRAGDSVFIKLFTGGSTGKPKVWPKTVVNVFSEALYLSKKFDVSHNDIIITTVPPYHIYGFLFTVLLPLVSSAAVIERICTFPREIISTVKNENPTVLVSVPVHYRILNGTEIQGNRLRAAFSSAGPLDKDDAEYFSKRTGVPLYEIYGSTETGGIATRCRARGEETLRANDNIEWKIEDERLCVKSDFISPEIPLDRDGFFMTGDRVEKDGENSFRLLGRIDGVVKIGGKRVDLGDVQDKIKTVPGVRDCVVIPLETSRGKEIEMGALVEGDIDDSILKQSLKGKLESYALPKRIKIVDKIPVASTGKYDKKKIEEFFNG